jgi:hypothetical protein
LDLWGSAKDDLWAVGTEGAIVHWDGSGWTDFSTGDMYDMESVWGMSSDDVWAFCARFALHWDGAEWSHAVAPETQVNGLWGAASDNIWAVGADGLVMHLAP